MVRRLKQLFGLMDTWPRPRPATVRHPDPGELATLEAFAERCDTCGAPFGCCTIDCEHYNDPTDPDFVEQERRRLWADTHGDEQ